jgi:hypothetical protein
MRRSIRIAPTWRTPGGPYTGAVRPYQYMQLTPEALQEFKRIVYEEHGVELSDDEASATAMQFLLLYEKLAEPLPGEVLTEPALSEPHPDPTIS